MALGALIGAYQEDDSGGIRALIPLAGRTLLEYQVRCAQAAGAAPIVVLVERVPQALQDAFERLRLEGIAIFQASDGNEAASRFEAGSMILLIADGVAPPPELVATLAEEPDPAVVTVPDDPEHEAFERIDAESRWAGIALVDAVTLGSTAAILGDWDLQSTLLRRAIQNGALRIPVAPEAPEPLLVDDAEQIDGFERRLMTASRGERRDWASRYVLGFVEEFATEQLAPTSVRPGWLVTGALVLTLAAAVMFTRGWLVAGVVALVVATPLDMIAARLAVLRFRPLPSRSLLRRLLWPAAGVAVLALGLWETRHGSGWGALVAAAGAAAFAQAARMERGALRLPGEIWLFSRRNAILAAIPFAIAGAWSSYLVALFVYAAASFFVIQHARHLGSG